MGYSREFEEYIAHSRLASPNQLLWYHCSLSVFHENFTSFLLSIPQIQSNVIVLRQSFYFLSRLLQHRYRRPKYVGILNREMFKTGAMN